MKFNKFFGTIKVGIPEIAVFKVGVDGSEVTVVVF